MQNYKPVLDLEETQEAINFLKSAFGKNLSKCLNLLLVQSPIFLSKDSGLPDDLTGTERMIEFQLKSGDEVVINHSLAKWKRMALSNYKFKKYNGIYTHMSAIRKDEVLSSIHSCYVDQWDWEMIIDKEERNIDTLKSIVEKIFSALKSAEEDLLNQYPQLTRKLPEKIVFVFTQDLEDRYPNISPKERELKVVKEHGAVFLMQIGKTLKSGKYHDLRAPDYDDWELNGDILVYSKHNDICIELSSMGIRVDAKSMNEQLTKSGFDNRRSLFFHQKILNNEFPLTVGGGIGQSRVCMFFLEKLHIGEVQASVWPKSMSEECKKQNITLL